MTRKEIEMEHEYQVEIVKKLLALEKNIYDTQSKLDYEKQQSAPPKPPYPKQPSVEKQPYPPVESSIKWSWKLFLIPYAIGILLGILLNSLPVNTFTWHLTNTFTSLTTIFFCIWPFALFIIHRKRKKADEQRIANSSEYLSQCDQIDNAYEKALSDAEKVFNEEVNIYETVTIPEWERSVDEWQSQHDDKLLKYHEKLNHLQDEAQKTYDSTKLIPVQYRSISVLEYVYDTISSSNYDVKQAIDMYDRNEQRKLDEARLREQQHANYLADQQNELLNEQNVIAEKARRDANIAAAANLVQQHNLNKMMKDRNKMMKDQLKR